MSKLLAKQFIDKAGGDFLEQRKYVEELYM